MKIAHKELCIGCTACVKICPKKCYTHAPAAGAKEASDAIAWALACASLGQNHLWQDLGLPSRNELSALIGHWFPSLAAKNTHNMKWKKFFYKQLCERENITICKAPTCGVCSDHAVCFGTEDGHAVTFH